MNFLLKKNHVISFVFFVVSATFFGQNALVTPPKLQKGDIVAILAPAGVVRGGDGIEKAKKLAESWGLKVVLGNQVYQKNYHFAGTDEQRAKDFQSALDNKNIKAIWAARGGYGSVRVLGKLDFSEFKKHPKWIIGYSDITAFHNHVHNFGIETLHALMPVSLEGDENEIKASIKSLKKAIFDRKLSYKIPSSKYNRMGDAEGQFIGGNLSLLASMLGSESQISMDGKILFIEDIGEYKYSIDRMLYSLKRAGYFKNATAIIVGGMTNLKRNTAPWGSTIEELILDVVPKNIPILFDFPAGHDADNRTLIFGRKVKLHIGKKKSSLVFERR